MKKYAIKVEGKVEVFAASDMEALELAREVQNSKDTCGLKGSCVKGEEGGLEGC